MAQNLLGRPSPGDERRSRLLLRDTPKITVCCGNNRGKANSDITHWGTSVPE